MSLITPQKKEDGEDNTLAGGGEMGLLMRAQNWQETPFGPMERWPQSLRTAVSICLDSRFPIIIFWGQELRQFYNDAYRPILGQSKHPQALGQAARDCWPEVWNVIGPMLNGVLTTGDATWSENQLLLLDRNGYLEECYFTFSYSPVRDESGEVGGVFCAVTETTGEVLNERRMIILRTLAANSASARTIEAICRVVVDTLIGAEKDLPFSLLYLLNEEGNVATLAGSTGLPPGTQFSPQRIELMLEESIWPLAVDQGNLEPVFLGDLVQRFGPDWNAQLQRAETAPQAWGMPHSALILPVVQPGMPVPYGFLIVGISPIRLLDADYQGFLALIAGQIATAIVSARAYQEAQERAEALAELNRAKTAFFSNVSHEFRTPLTLMLGPLESVLADSRHSLDPAYRSQLEIVHRNGLRQLRLVNTLLDFSRLEAERMQARYTAVDLSTLTLDLVSTFRSAIETAGLQLLVDCPPLGEPLYVDQEMWEKIVLNLLSNALKFTFEGYIQVSMQMQAEGALLTVSDSGVGIAKEDLPHLFERFYQARNQQARTREGSGIGLSLVQELVHLHGGSISVASTIGEGTTFSVLIPRGSKHLPAEQISPLSVRFSTLMNTISYVEEVRRWLPNAQPPASNVPLQQTRNVEERDEAGQREQAHLLIVDDNADMRVYIEHLLSGPEYIVRTASTGQYALEIVQVWMPDLIISDIMMPGMDGFELLAAIRADPLLQAIPVIFLSARAGEEATVEGLRAGIDDYLVKPFSARELQARVAARLEIARLRRVAMEEQQRLLAREQAALVEAETARQRLYDLFMHAPALICILRGPLHVYELANEHYAQLLGKRDMVGKPIREVLPEFAGQGVFELLDHVYSTGEPFIGTEMRFLLDRKNNGQLEEGYFDFTYLPSRNAQGEIDGILVHAVEVTERVRARLRTDTFLGIASHELKTPLTAIKANVQLARRRLARIIGGLANEETLEGIQGQLRETQTVLERAERQTSFQNRLISDLVDTARIQAEKLELRLAEADLCFIVRDAVEEQRNLTPSRTILLLLPEDGGTLPVVVDIDRIRQVVSNYLSNALKYSEQSCPVTVRVTRGEADAYYVAVTDEGPGLAQEQQEHIWERFYRVPGVTVRSGSGVGLGLGLYICRTIIEQHGGQVGVESVPGEGATFWFMLSHARKND